MKIVIINGPNLNLLGKRETEIYGTDSFEEYLEKIKRLYPKVELEYFQSNSEGAIIDYIQKKGFESRGIILNAGAFTHTSIAIADAIASISAPVIEVHISNVYKREEYRHHSFIAAKCTGIIAGFGLESYRLAVEFIINIQ
ncbi:MAG TPA: type II 3-dehydroquinate dehydratase [Cyclobacteriaceae bacterium]|nr:type II 3-dehydroquinate dehydratase [Cyclobacteriaceae bacterium]